MKTIQELETVLAKANDDRNKAYVDLAKANDDLHKADADWRKANATVGSNDHGSKGE